MYVQSDTLLLADVSENFRNMFIKIYELDPACFLTAPRWTCQAASKKNNAKLDLLIDIDIMVQKGIRGGICHSAYWYAKVDSKYTKDLDKNKKLSCLQYWDVNRLYGSAMLEKLPVNIFEWIKGTSQFNEDLIENYNEETDDAYFPKVDV